uniref:Uncharacterized protein n=1 Tax=Nelumbo nucifera TaxID=4432 RepID=A0A822ZEF5_NELNU|nr:TPA_asm: hypothetical protein HUJ06_016118 [Nelumbo nucifera]
MMNQRHHKVQALSRSVVITSIAIKAACSFRPNELTSRRHSKRPKPPSSNHWRLQEQRQPSLLSLGNYLDCHDGLLLCSSLNLCTLGDAINVCSRRPEADDLFFQGQILPLRLSISFDSGFAGFRQDTQKIST